MMLHGVELSNPSEQMHHIVAINVDEGKRMDFDNWLAVCIPCHEALEGDVISGMHVKEWSKSNYVDKLNEGLS